jgi:hypothetical protein
MSTVKLEPRVAITAGRKVAAAGRDSERELDRLRSRALAWRLALITRGIIDPNEELTSAAEWRKWALDGFDAAQHAGTDHNRERFRSTTASVMEDCRDEVLALSPQMLPFIRGCGLALGRMTAFDSVFIARALAMRAEIDSNGLGTTTPRPKPVPKAPAEPEPRPQTTPQARTPSPRLRVIMPRAPANAPKVRQPPFDRARLAVQMPWVVRPGTLPQRNRT